MNVRIEQLECELAQKLAIPLKNAIPGHYQLRVSLLDEKGRKKRSNASANNWSPSSGRIEIRFEASAEAEKNVVPAGVPQTIVQALHRAESTPGWNFVSLKKFRDEILPHEPITSGSFQPTEVHWQEAIRSAIDKRWILTGKVQNPKSPQFPVTSIRLNRLMPQIQEILGQPKKDLGFHPIHIKGEPLSATILRERR